MSRQWSRPLARLVHPSQSWVIAAVTIVAFVLLTAYLYQATNRSVTDQAQARFDAQADQAAQSIGKRLTDYAQVLRGAQGLFLTNLSVSAEDWRQYVDNLKVPQAYPGLQAVGFVERQFNLGDPDRQVVRYLEPGTPANSGVIGYDINSESNRQAALELARDSGAPIVTDRINLVQDTGTDQPAVIMLLPVYRNGQPQATVEERRAALQGFVDMVFRVNDLMRGIRGQTFPDFTVNLTDLNSGQSLYDDAAARQLAAHPDPAYRHRVTIQAPGRIWAADFASQPGFEASVDRTLPWLVLFGGGLVGLLLLATALSLITRGQRAQKLARQLSARARHRAADLRREVVIRQQAERELSQAARRDEALRRSLGEGLLVIDAQGRITDVNPMAARILGRRPRDLLGQALHDRVTLFDRADRPLPPDDRPYRQALALGRPVARRAQLKRPNGETVAVAVTAAPVVIRRKPIGVIEVLRDVTKEARLERAKDEFVSLASHQLRTPASGVKALLSMLVKGDLGKLAKVQQQFVREAYETNDLQLAVIDDLLNVARVESGDVALERRRVDARSLVKAAAARQRATASRRRQRLTVSVPRRPVWIWLDAVKIGQVIDNLIDNASKYTPRQGSITVRVATRAGLALIAVADTGVGIKAGDRPKLFKKFSRLDNRLAGERSGTGLGLYLAKRLVELHRGTISVTSRYRQGTTFTIELPRRNRR